MLIECQTYTTTRNLIFGNKYAHFKIKPLSVFNRGSPWLCMCQYHDINIHFFVLSYTQYHRSVTFIDFVEDALTPRLCHVCVCTFINVL